MNWIFYLDALEIDEPAGFAEFTIRAKRDDVWHGVFFEASASDLSFYGEAAAYLQEKRDNQGFAAVVVFRAVSDCGEEFSGNLDFRKFKATCGNDCTVTMPVEQPGCLMTLRNRYDQKVDLDTRLGFDGLTVLPDYSYMNFEMMLAAQELFLGDEATPSEDELFDIADSPEWFPNEGGITINAYLMPFFDTITNSSLGNFSPYSTIEFVNGGFNNAPPLGASIPIITIDGDTVCGVSGAELEYRLKGTIVQTTTGTSVTNFTVKLFRLPAGLDEMDTASYEQVYELLMASLTNDDTADFDVTATIPLPDINPGDQFFLGVFVRNFTGQPEVDTLTFLQDQDSFFRTTASGLCPETEAAVSMVHEALSLITEAITDRCLTVKSDYYGRVDSQPYEAATDGCGGLRVLTSGLRLRRSENPKHFLSLKDAYDSLNAIDNIGMAVETDVLRIEPVRYFYQDVEVMSMPYIPAATYELQERLAYSIVKVGYKKWETENVNGLDEFNSNKEFRSTLTSIDNTLDITSNFIAGGYPIEHTRQQSFAETGAADTKYDNDTFIIVVEREAYGFHVEQGVIDNAANIYSPATAYNWRIRPMYNLMRWWKSIASSYVSLMNTASRFMFSAGTGNLEATGDMLTDPCRVETVTKPENGNLAVGDVLDSTPIWKPETVNFRYPMSMKEYNLVKQNPYGFISFQCGKSAYEKGYIINLLYHVADGEADITLKVKWQQ